ncbi:MAG: DUF1552 domain-containing protein [Myxococcales bacterium]|nr:DUF1552 domain-containing protein [Myxococcales bacterium]
MTRIDRRAFLKLGGAALLAAPFARPGRSVSAHAHAGTARRLIVFNFPDGVVGPSSDGEPSLWHPTGGETSFSLPAELAPLERHRGACVFFRGLSMGPADQGSHPGGAKKLLTGVDGGNGVSIDQHLAATVGATSPFRHLYLGAMARHNGASGDKHISYVAPGITVAPDDDPVAAFGRLFAGGSTSGGGPDPAAARELSVLDSAAGELEALRGALGERDRVRLELHLESLREVEARIMATGGGGGATCTDPRIDGDGLTPATLYAPERFPQILRAQTDLMVQAMACGLTKVGVIQASHHTSELIMSRFAGTPMYDPGFDMRSHQASHYGPRHDLAHREYRDYLAQRVWWVEQFAYLLDQLAARPEDGGTMLDHSLVLLATEVCDGNTHGHDDMPFVLAGGGGGAIRTGRLLSFDYRRHADLLVALAHAMGDPIGGFGEASSGPLPGLLA